MRNIWWYFTFRSEFAQRATSRDDRILFLDSIPSFDSIQTRLYCIRREFIPPAPDNQADLDISTNWFKCDEESIVIGDSFHSDGLRTLVFSTTEAMEILSRAEIIHGDGTFKICPYLWYQVFIMYASVGPNSVVPVVFALLPDKKYRSYFDLFSNLSR